MNSFLRRLRIRIFHWEYWPWQIVYMPVFLYWIFLSIRSGSPLYLCGANPRIRNGGMLGVSKFSILRMIPEEYRPAGILVEPAMHLSVIRKAMENASLSFPVIAKPDVGERGFMVRKLTSEKEVKDYADALGHRFILQELIDLPVEAGIFYYRFPGDRHGKVSSIVIKKMLTVTGNGHQKLGELIHGDDRAYLQYERLRKAHGDHWEKIVPEGQTIELESIGNHCLGTTFLNGNDLITPALEKFMDTLADRIDGFYYGRFDIRAGSKEGLENGGFKVLELNGAAAEPAHIYHPGASFLKGQKTLFHHWNVMFRISMMNRKRDKIRYPGFMESVREYRRFRMLKTLRS